MVASTDSDGIHSLNEHSEVHSRSQDDDATKSNGHAFFEGRLSCPMSDLLLAHNEIPRVAWELKHLKAVLQVDFAHVVMLHEQSLLDRAYASAIVEGLNAISQAGPAGMSTEPGLGSIVLQIEKTLADLVGEDTAGRLSTARSRLDQGATVRRIADREQMLLVANNLLALQDTVLRAAEKHRNVASLSYTHLQQAQPATFGHYLLGYHSRLVDCFDQLAGAYERMNRSPLGAVGLSGTDIPIARDSTAALLGFSNVLDNSRTGRDAYYQVEITTCLAMIMTVLNDLCTELHVFSSSEFGTVELDDSHCSTSSIFPQKKNPYALETVKGNAGEAVGWVAGAFATLRCEGTGDSAVREIKQLDGYCDTTSSMLRLTAEVVERMVVHKERYEHLLSEAWVTTNRLGNVLLVKYGMSYRSAHSVVARLVRNSTSRRIRKNDVTTEMLKDAGTQMCVEVPAITSEELRLALDHTEFLSNNISFGGVGPQEFERLLALGTKQSGDIELWIEDKVKSLADAERLLQNAADKLREARTVSKTNGLTTSRTVTLEGTHSYEPEEGLKP
jgi:argininosuccinate lyase